MEKFVVIIDFWNIIYFAEKNSSIFAASDMEKRENKEKKGKSLKKKKKKVEKIILQYILMES